MDIRISHREKTESYHKRHRIHVGSSEVTSGITQGSVLDPILFVIFINDLPDVISTSAKLFADDTKVYDKTNGTNSAAALQSDLNNLVEWSEKWQMKFHLEKSPVQENRS